MVGEGGFAPAGGRKRPHSRQHAAWNGGVYGQQKQGELVAAYVEKELTADLFGARPSAFVSRCVDHDQCLQVGERVLQGGRYQGEFHFPSVDSLLRADGLAKQVYISNTSSGTQEQYSVHLPTFFSAADNPRTGARVNLGASRSALVELGACPVPRRGADAIRNPEEIGAVGMDVDTLSFVFMVLGPNKQLIPITASPFRSTPTKVS